MVKLVMTVPVLERLIGGDSEIEVELRKAVAQEFMKRHLKAVCDDEAVKAATEEAKRYVNDLAAQHFGVKDAVTNAWRQMDERLKNSIMTAVDTHVQAAIEQATQRIIDRQITYVKQQIEVAVQRSLKINIEAAVARGVQERLDAAKCLIDKEIAEGT